MNSKKIKSLKKSKQSKKDTNINGLIVKNNSDNHINHLPEDKRKEDINKRTEIKSESYEVELNNKARQPKRKYLEPAEVEPKKKRKKTNVDESKTEENIQYIEDLKENSSHAENSSKGKKRKTKTENHKDIATSLRSEDKKHKKRINEEVSNDSDLYDDNDIKNASASHVDNLENSKAFHNQQKGKKKKVKKIIEPDFDDSEININKKIMDNKWNLFEAASYKLSPRELSIKDEDSDQYLSPEEVQEENFFLNQLSNEDDSNLENLHSYYSKKDSAKNKRDEKLKICWPTEDLTELVRRIECCIPMGDHMSYKCRLTKLEWDKVPFKNYTIEECQKVWAQLEKKVRHYRLLIEILQDIKQVIAIPEEASTRVLKSKKHPDMPKRPLTSYFLYYIQKKDKVLSEHPDLDMIEVNRIISEQYKSLSPEKKAKYAKLAEQNKEEYRRKMEVFYATHPEVPRQVKIKKVRERKKKIREKPIKPPKRPETPYKLFYFAEYNREQVGDNDKSEFKEVCREKWRQMSDKKKMVWINYAEEKFLEYQEAMKEFLAKHPNHVQNASTKAILSKEELMLKERMAGKPRKPPGSAYGLFVSEMLQTAEIKAVPVRERLNYVSSKWKDCSALEKDHYKELVTKLNDEYQMAFMAYLDTLPEDKRQAEMLQNMPKKKKNESDANSAKKQTKINKVKEEKFEEPEQPPRSLFKYFAKQYTGTESVNEAWKNISPEQKARYKKELVEKKQQYIIEFERFLKSLTKEELEEFSRTRKQNNEESDEDDVDSVEEEDSEDSYDDSSEDSDG